MDEKLSADEWLKLMNEWEQQMAQVAETINENPEIADKIYKTGEGEDNNGRK